MSEEPNIIHSFKRNEEQSVLITLEQYQNKYYVDFRIWYPDPDEGGLLKPTRKGISLPIDFLDELQKALDKMGEIRAQIREENKTAQAPAKSGYPAAKQPFTGRNEASRMTPKAGPASRYK